MIITNGGYPGLSPVFPYDSSGIGFYGVLFDLGQQLQPYLPANGEIRYTVLEDGEFEALSGSPQLHLMDGQSLYFDAGASSPDEAVKAGVVKYSALPFPQGVPANFGYMRNGQEDALSRVKFKVLLEYSSDYTNYTPIAEMMDINLIAFDPVYFDILASDAPPAAGCFWTDLVGVDQVCPSAEPPAGLVPQRRYLLNMDNGASFVTLDREVPDQPEGTFFGSFYGADGGIAKRNGLWVYQASFRSNDYYPSNDGDYVEAAVQLYRVPRILNYDNPVDYEPVGTMSLTAHLVYKSNSGNMPDIFEGYFNDDLINNMDPSYIYLIESTLDIFNAGGTLITAGVFAEAAVYDHDAEGALIADSLQVVPVEFESYQVQLIGCQAFNLYPYAGGMGISWVGGMWKALAPDLICSEFTAAVGGQPPQQVYPSCS